MKKTENIGDFIENLIAKAKKFSWNKNTIIRYVYIELGKELVKSPDFFLSKEEKLGDKQLSVEQMKRIHESEAAYETTCKVTAKMLAKIFSALGIKTELRNAVNPQIYVNKGVEYPIYHTYLIVEGDDFKQYFLSLNNDLANIKANSKTECFGANIEYYYQGAQNYEGKEIKHSLFSDKEIMKIDKEIGYTIPIKDEQNKDVFIYTPDFTKQDVYGNNRGKMGNAEDFLELKLEQLDPTFLPLLNNFCKKTGKNNLSQLSQTEFNYLEWSVLYVVYNLISVKLGVNTSIPDNLFDKMFDEFFVDENNIDTTKMINQITEVIKKNPKSETDKTPYKILREASHFINAMNYLRDHSSKPDENKTQLAKYRNLFQDSKKTLSKYFIPEEKFKQYVGNNNPSSEFIYDKLKTMFEYDFECETSKVSNYKPDILNKKMGLIEQTIFFKKYLLKIFRNEFPTEDDFYDRIIFSCMTLKNDKNIHAFLIHIKAKENNGVSYTLLYDPQINQLKSVNYLYVKMDYNIYSKTMRNHFEEVSERSV